MVSCQCIAGVKEIEVRLSPYNRSEVRKRTGLSLAQRLYRYYLREYGKNVEGVIVTHNRRDDNIEIPWWTEMGNTNPPAAHFSATCSSGKAEIVVLRKGKE